MSCIKSWVSLLVLLKIILNQNVKQRDVEGEWKKMKGGRRIKSNGKSMINIHYKYGKVIISPS